MIALDRGDLEAQAWISANRLRVQKIMDASEYEFDVRDTPAWVPAGARCAGSRLLSLWLGLSENVFFSALLGADDKRCRELVRFINRSVASPHFVRFANALELNLDAREAVNHALDLAIGLFMAGGMIDKSLWRAVSIPVGVSAERG